MSTIPAASPPTPRCALTPERVRCTVYNRGVDYGIECLEPYLVVRETGDIFDGSRRWCSDAIRPGGVATFDALEGIRPADICGPRLDGCEVRLFEDRDHEIADVAAFARASEASATRPGTQPTMRACDDARRAWLAVPELDKKYRSLLQGEPDAVVLFCKLHLTPAEVACFGKARSEAEVEACAPEK